MSPKFIPCADFDDLASLDTLDRDILHSVDPKKTKLNTFILSLALIFNDLKGLLWVHGRLEEGKPKDKKPTPYMGQWGGMNIQYWRLACGVLRELLIAIDKNVTVIQHEDFILCLKKQDKIVMRAWKNLVDVSAGHKKPGTSLGHFLLMIRNNLSFHYFQSEMLMMGYEKWREKEVLGSEAAYMSRGRNMSESRFYFADAASETCFLDELNKNKMNFSNVSEFVKQVNNALRFIVAAYMLLEQKKCPKRS